MLKHVFESRIALRRTFQEMIVQRILRQIFAETIILRRIFNYSEEDISEEDNSGI